MKSIEPGQFGIGSTATGLTHEVSFTPVVGPINDRIDEAYRTKYRDSPYLNPMIGAGPRAATVQIVPREDRRSS